MLTLRVPTINEDAWSFDQLFRLWSEASGDDLEVCFDFSGCGFLRQNGVAFLGGLARLIEYRGGSVEFAWNTLENAIAMNLAQNGFQSAFGCSSEPWFGNSIPYREDDSRNDHDFIRYLSDCWLGREWINVSSDLRDVIVGRVAEVYLNAFEHADSPIGVFTCGQHYPKNRELNLTIADFGVGIPSNVRLFHGKDFRPEQLSASSCIRWAFQSGTSTKLGGRGIGLDLLQDFVRKNRGRLEIFSHEGYALVTENGVSFGDRQTLFEGTLVNISLRCDEKHYCLTSELSFEPPF